VFFLWGTVYSSGSQPVVRGHLLGASWWFANKT